MNSDLYPLLALYQIRSIRSNIQYDFIIRGGDYILFLLTIGALEPDDQQFVMNIYEKYIRLMFKKARKYSDDICVVEDLVQDSLIKLILHVSTLKTLTRCSLTAYIVYTVENAGKNYLRHKDVKKKYIREGEFPYSNIDAMSQAPTPEDVVMRFESAEDFRRMWENLSEEDKGLLEGKYILDLDDAHLASLLEIKPASIRMKLTRARRRAIKLLKEELQYDET